MTRVKHDTLGAMSVEDLLIPALRQLKVLSHKSDKVPRHALELLFNWFTVSQQVETDSRGEMQKAVEALDNVSRLLLELNNQLLALPKVASWALSREAPDPIALANDLMRLREVTHRGIRDLKVFTRTPTGAGHPPNIIAIRVAQTAAFIYHDLTGKQPSRNPTGPFVRFLRQVFDALAIKGTAQHYGNLASKDFKAAINSQLKPTTLLANLTAISMDNYVAMCAQLQEQLARRGNFGSVDIRGFWCDGDRFEWLRIGPIEAAVH